MTELVIDLAGHKRVVGRTKFCVNPKKDSTKAIKQIGGTKNPKIEQILALKPDLILANKEENLQDHIELLQKQVPVYVSNVKTIQDNFDIIADLGAMVQNPQAGFELLADTEAILKSIKKLKNKSVAYLIWRDPYMVAGGDTFINTMLAAFGLKNVFEDQIRYPKTTVDALKNYDPDFIFLSSEPYPFSDKHIEELMPAKMKSKIILVDGEFFSWYGNRIIQKREYIDDLLKQLK